MAGGTVNRQITDAVTQANTSAIGLAPSLSLALTYTAMADSVAHLMQNAVTAQQNGQTIGASATAVTCATIIAFAVKGAASP